MSDNQGLPTGTRLAFPVRNGRAGCLPICESSSASDPVDFDAHITERHSEDGRLCRDLQQRFTLIDARTCWVLANFRKGERVENPASDLFRISGSAVVTIRGKDLRGITKSPREVSANLR